MFGWECGWRLKSLLDHLWLREEFGLQKKCCAWKEKVWFGKKKVRGEGQGSEAAVCQEPVLSSPACLCWRYLHRFCWWYNSAYILHSSLPLLQAVFNTAQDVNWNVCWMLTKQNSGCVQNLKRAKKGKVIWGITQVRDHQTLVLFMKACQMLTVKFISEVHTTIRPHLVLTSKPWN